MALSISKKLIKSIIIITLSCAALLIILLSAERLGKHFINARVKFVESSYNKEESAALQNRITERLGQYAHINVRVYDSVERCSQKYKYSGSQKIQTRSGDTKWKGIYGAESFVPLDYLTLPDSVHHYVN